MDISFFFFLLLLLTLYIIRSILIQRKTAINLPPGPSFFSSNLLLLTTKSSFEPILKNLKSKYGPLFTLSIGSRPFIFVGDREIAHQLLIKKGAVISDRPPSFGVCNITTAAYGPTWRFLRRNLVSKVLHPSCVKSYSWARKRVLQTLIGRLQDNGGIIKVVDHFRYAMFNLLVLMCFGEKLDDRQIDEIAEAHRRMLFLAGSGRLNVFGIFPRLGKILFRNRWKELLQIRNDQEQVLLPLIKSRIETANSKADDDDQIFVSYVDTLLNLQFPENGGKLTDKEMASMCSEFLNGGTDTTSTALQWIMANLVKHPHIQNKLYDEIITVVGPPPPSGVESESVINVEDLKKMSYLKAVVLEGLRRHPPSHFVLPHRVSKEVEVEGHMIPEGAAINFFVAEMGWDPKVWEDPMEFKPERFLMNDDTINDGFDITGSKEIKMMPFGAGRRICPAADLAMLHLEYFVANLIWLFRWTAADGYDVDLSEKVEVAVVMKNPLHTRIFPRAEK